MTAERSVMFGFAVLLAVASCKSKKGPPSCEDAISKAAGKIPRFAEPKAKAEAVGECIKDQWPESTRTCIAGIRDEPDMVACMMRLKPSGGSKGETKDGSTKIKVKKYANDGFRDWQSAHQDKQCPDKLSDLNEYMNDQSSDATKDAWGRELKFFCGPTLPAGATGLAVMSLGEDGQENTGDDIKSWDPRD